MAEVRYYTGHIVSTVRQTIEVSADSPDRAIDLIREAVATENLVRHDIGMEPLELVAVVVESDQQEYVWKKDKEEKGGE